MKLNEINKEILDYKSKSVDARQSEYEKRYCKVLQVCFFLGKCGAYRNGLVRPAERVYGMDLLALLPYCAGAFCYLELYAQPQVHVQVHRKRAQGNVPCLPVLSCFHSDIHLAWGLSGGGSEVERLSGNRFEHAAEFCDRIPFPAFC